MREELSHSRTVTDAIYGAGFNSSGRFYEKSAEILGMTPTDFRAGGQHTAIRYATGVCSLGTVLVAATEKGVCAILLGDDAGDAGAESGGAFSASHPDCRRPRVRAHGGRRW